MVWPAVFINVNDTQFPSEWKYVWRYLQKAIFELTFVHKSVDSLTGLGQHIFLWAVEHQNDSRCLLRLHQQRVELQGQRNNAKFFTFINFA